MRVIPPIRLSAACAAGVFLERQKKGKPVAARLLEFFSLALVALLLTLLAAVMPLLAFISIAGSLAFVALLSYSEGTKASRRTGALTDEELMERLADITEELGRRQAKP